MPRGSWVVALITTLSLSVFMFLTDGQLVLSRKVPIQEPVETLSDERGNMGPLRKYNNKDIFINIPSDLDINDFKAFSVYCAKYKLDFGHAFFPAADKPLKPFSLLSAKVNMASAKKLGSFTTILHNVQGEVYALDEGTLFIKNFTYDGTSPGNHKNHISLQKKY